MTPDRLAQELEAVLDMRDPGLLVGEFETPLLQELFHERFDSIFEENLRRACDNEVIRITNQVNLTLPVPAPRNSKAFRQQPLQSIQGSVRQGGRNNTALR